MRTQEEKMAADAKMRVREAQMIAEARAGEPITRKTELGGIRQMSVERACDGKLYVFLGLGDEGQPEWFLIDLDRPKDDAVQLECMHRSRAEMGLPSWR